MHPCFDNISRNRITFWSNPFRDKALMITFSVASLGGQFSRTISSRSFSASSHRSEQQKPFKTVL
uniref:Uncharacterized protein n=1 Tax=Arundo donax TaxID=35708 RepID=A0A0A9DWN9_ARUDO